MYEFLLSVRYCAFTVLSVAYLPIQFILLPNSQHTKSTRICRKHKFKKYFWASSSFSLFAITHQSLSVPPSLPLIGCGLPDVSLSRNYTLKWAQVTTVKVTTWE